MFNFGLVLGLLAAVAFLAALGRRASLPNPIVFAFGGLVLAVIPGMPLVALPPELVLVVFLPPLIYAAAQDTSWAEIKDNARSILLLAVGLVLATMTAVAVVTHALLPTLPWSTAFILGAIVAPPDAVAAKAIADTLNLPRRMVAVLEGEGLINDATALVAFHVASSVAVAGHDFTAGRATVEFLFSAVAAVVIGIGIGWLGHRVLSHLGDAAAENTLMLLMPFAAYLLAEEIHASGVLAVLTVALYLGQFGLLSLSSGSRLQGRALWEMIDFILTGLSFVLVGLQLRSVVNGLTEPTNRVLFATLAICLTVVLIRPAWVFGMSWLSRRMDAALYGESHLPPPPTKQSLTIISWAGMRGVVSLAIALSLPQTTASGAPLPGRALVVFVTFAVILVTLMGQGLTLPALIRRIGTGTAEEREDEQEVVARLRMARRALKELDELGGETSCQAEIVERVRGNYADRIERLERQRDAIRSGEADQRSHLVVQQAATRKLMGKLLQIEQTELQRMRTSFDVDNQVAHRIQSSIDLQRAREER